MGGAWAGHQRLYSFGPRDRELDEATGSVVTPIYQTVTFGFKKADDVGKAVKGESGDFVLFAMGQPDQQGPGKEVAHLEEAEEAAFFSSGMAAISSAVLAHVQKGDHVTAIRRPVWRDLRLFHEDPPEVRGGDEPRGDRQLQGAEGRGEEQHQGRLYRDTHQPDHEGPRPRRDCDDAHGVGALLLVDDTFASPLGQKPLRSGEISSCTAPPSTWPGTRTSSPGRPLDGRSRPRR